MSSIVARRIIATPARQASGAWAKMVDLIAPDQKSSARKELESVAGKRARFQHIAANFKKTCVDLFNDRGFSQHKVFIAAFSSFSTGFQIGSSRYPLRIVAPERITTFSDLADAEPAAFVVMPPLRLPVRRLLDSD